MPLKMLQEVMTLDLLEMANVLVKLFLGQGKIVEYLDVICTEEINETSKSCIGIHSIIVFIQSLMHDNLFYILSQTIAVKR